MGNRYFTTKKNVNNLNNELSLKGIRYAYMVNILQTSGPSSYLHPHNSSLKYKITLLLGFAFGPHMVVLRRSNPGQPSAKCPTCYTINLAPKSHSLNHILLWIQKMTECSPHTIIKLSWYIK